MAERGKPISGRDIQYIFDRAQRQRNGLIPKDGEL